MKRFSAVLLLFVVSAVAAQDNCGYRIKISRADTVWISHGTAGAIDKRHLLTAGHCAKNVEEMWVEVGAEWRKCTPERVDLEMDIALLVVEFDLPQYADLADSTEPKVHENADIYGSMEGEPVSKCSGPISSLKSDMCRIVDARVKHGCSGAPVIINKLIAGIVVSFHPNGGDENARDGVACFLPARRIHQFLDEKK